MFCNPSLSNYLYKDDVFLANDRKISITDDFSQLLSNYEDNDSLNKLQQLLIFAQICFPHIKIKSKEETDFQTNLNYNFLLNDHFLDNLAKILYENINPQSILIAFHIVSLISYSNKEICYQNTLLVIIKLIVSNISLLTPKQLNQININILLKIIRKKYKQDFQRKDICNIFPIEFVINSFLNHVELRFSQHGVQWLKFLNTFCSYNHSKNDGRLIFDCITKIRSKFTTNCHINYFCHIFINMIKFQTLPNNLFTLNNYHIYLHDLISGRNNVEIFQHALYLIGLCTLNNIITGYFNAGFFINIFYNNSHDDYIRVMALWNLSVGLNHDISHFLIENNFLNYIIEVYQSSSFNLKHEIASLITDMMCVSTDSPDVFLSNQILEILIDAMMIFNNDITKIAFTLCRTIEDSIVQNQKIVIASVRKFLDESNFIEIIELLENSEDLLNIQLSHEFLEFLQNK